MPSHFFQWQHILFFLCLSMNNKNCWFYWKVISLNNIKNIEGHLKDILLIIKRYNFTKTFTPHNFYWLLFPISIKSKTDYRKLFTTFEIIKGTFPAILPPQYLTNLSKWGKTNKTPVFITNLSFDFGTSLFS